MFTQNAAIDKWNTNHRQCYETLNLERKYSNGGSQALRAPSFLVLFIKTLPVFFENILAKLNNYSKCLMQYQAFCLFVLSATTSFQLLSHKHTTAKSKFS